MNGIANHFPAKNAPIAGFFMYSVKIFPGVISTTILLCSRHRNTVPIRADWLLKPALAIYADNPISSGVTKNSDTYTDIQIEPSLLC